MTKEEQEALDRVRPLCVECKHHMIDELWNEHKCDLTARVTADKVKGTARTLYRNCDTERNLGLQGSCGRTGKNFEQAPPVKQSWLDKVIAWIK